MKIAERLAQVLAELSTAATRAGREISEISLVAVSKKQPLGSMLEYINAANERGVRVIFGENYLQELKHKREAIGQDVELHMIGPLQSNKIRDAVRLADVIQSVHSSSVITGVAKEARKVAKSQRIFLQVNIGNDSAKSGFLADQVDSALAAVESEGEALVLEGLMTITPFYDQAELARGDFKTLALLRQELLNRGWGRLFKDSKIKLSMGMSGDYQVAIEEGADLVRIGTALFGERV